MKRYRRTDKQNLRNILRDRKKSAIMGGAFSAICIGITMGVGLTTKSISITDHLFYGSGAIVMGLLYVLFAAEIRLARLEWDNLGL